MLEIRKRKLRKKLEMGLVLWLMAGMVFSGCHHVFPFLKHDHGKHSGPHQHKKE
ncbi:MULTISPECIES: hypothetical protein [unclassified Nitrospina]|uniref:hypothetical protein n=1 Tax=unclassified Nitrospina TaxID=2638683 RepID=UPI003F9E717B